MDMIGTVLPLALVVGLSPLPMMPAVLLLMSQRPRPNGLAFLSLWLVSLTLVVSLAIWLGGLADPEPSTDNGVGWIQVVTGIAFLGLAGAKWVRRPRAGQAKEPPKWIAALHSYSPAQSARLGALLAGANPKNLAMALAAGAEIAFLATGPASMAVGLLGFVLIGSIGVGVPILASVVLGERVAPALKRGKSWLDSNSTSLSVGVLVVLGVLLLAKGLPTAL